MPKKSKRQVRRSSPSASSTSSMVNSSSSSLRSSDRDFSPNYNPVLGDLKRVGTLAGSFFVVLVILSFILR